MADMQLDDFKHRVATHETGRGTWYSQVERWERAFNLQAWDQDAAYTREVLGREQVTRLTPFNTVLAGMRIIPSDVKIEVGTANVKESEEEASGRRERFLDAAWRQASRQAGVNLVSDAKFFSLVRGAHAFDLRWVGNILPETMRDSRLPFLLRVLDPKNVGVHYGPIYPLFAYHKYQEDVLDFAQRYPDVNLEKFSNWRRRSRYNTATKIEVVDYWWREKNGKIWNVAWALDQYIIRPTETEYPELPIVEGFGDSVPLAGKTHRRMSILHSLEESGQWEYENRLASQVATGLMYHFYPVKKITREQGASWDMDGLEIGPDATVDLPAGVNLDWLSGNVNIPLAESMMALVSQDIQQATFSDMTYGEGPSSASGYAINQLTGGSRARVRLIQENLESSMTDVSRIILALVEKFADDEGVTISGKSRQDGRQYRETLTPADIDGYYEVDVSLIGESTQEALQWQVMALRLVEAGIMSKQTFRDLIMDMDTPRDEDIRIVIEKAIMEDPELTKRAALQAFKERYAENYRAAIAGTSLEAMDDADKAKRVAEREGKENAQLPVPEPPAPEAPPLPGMEPVPPSMMGGGPPGMMGAGPPGMTPPPAAQGPAAAGPGPGGPTAGGGGLPAGGMPQLPPGIMPPQMQGITPEMLGLPPGTPPEILAELLGQAPPSLEQQMGMPPMGGPGLPGMPI